RPSRPWPSYVLLIVVSVFAGVAICEAGMRLSGIRFSASFFTPDPILGWSLRPRARGWYLDEGESYVEINRDGQRDREREPERPIGSYRVAVLGDSMVEAMQVSLEKTFTMLSESMLSGCGALAGERAEVLNFGIAGFGTIQEFLLL